MMAAHRHLARRERVPRNFRDRSNPLEDLSEEDVFSRYRFRPESILDLMRQLPNLQSTTQRNHPLPPLLQVLVALRFLATGATHILVRDDINISRSTAGRAVRHVSRLIADLVPRYINFPRGNRAREVKTEFSQIAGFPRVLGCIDGTHIRISKPSGPQEADFVNRKNFHSLNVQMVCDAQFRITSLSCNWPGATHDNRIFRTSVLCQQFEQGDHDGLLLGDSGYQCRSFLMTPFINPVGESQKRYNIAHCRTRVLIEQTFGFLKKRFQCLQHLRVTPSQAVVYIKAAVTLHNYGIERGEALGQPCHIHVQTTTQQTEQSMPGGDGAALRAHIVQSFFS